MYRNLYFNITLATTMFNKIKAFFTTIYETLSTKLSDLFSSSSPLDDHFFESLETILIQADTGINTTRFIISELKSAAQEKKIQNGEELKLALKEILHTILRKAPTEVTNASIYLMVGINGTGKTTCAGKLAHHFVQTGKKVLLVAADTFRAAAVKQLTEWAAHDDITVISGNEGQDPSSVIFNGCTTFVRDNYDIMIIDTAGRLHNKVNLMHELAKMTRILKKQVPNHTISTLLTLDSMLGQNTFEQAKLFKECTNLTGIFLTKMDSTGKGGIVFSIIDQLHIPIIYTSFGEKRDQFSIFNPHNYVDMLIQ